MTENGGGKRMQAIGVIAKPAAPVRVPLRTVRDVHRELCRTYRLLVANSIDAKQSGARVYVLQVLHRVMGEVELEERLARVESKLREQT